MLVLPSIAVAISIVTLLLLWLGMRGVQRDLTSARVEAAENRRSHREEIVRTLEASSQRVIAAVTDHGATQRQDLQAVRAQVAARSRYCSRSTRATG